jgi:Ca2+-dependent lipid-binding protein
MILTETPSNEFRKTTHVTYIDTEPTYEKLTTGDTVTTVIKGTENKLAIDNETVTDNVTKKVAEEASNDNTCKANLGLKQSNTEIVSKPKEETIGEIDASGSDNADRVGVRGLKSLLTEENITDTDSAQGAESKNNFEEKKLLDVESELQTVSYFGKLKLIVQQAKDLEKKDRNKKADPYIVINFGNQTSKSKKKKKTLTPIWNHEVELDVNNTSSEEIEISVMDWDRLGKDDPMGRVLLPVNLAVNKSLQGSFWIDLQESKSGQIMISTEFNGNKVHNKQQFTSTSPLAAKEKTPDLKDQESKLKITENKKEIKLSSMEDKEAKGEIVSKLLHVTVHKARNLENCDIIGKSDPFVIIKCASEEVKSRKIRNNLNPEWQFQTTFHINKTVCHSPEELEIKIMDDDFGKSNPMGELNLDIENLKDAPVINKWLPLNKCKKGEILVSATYIASGTNVMNITLDEHIKEEVEIKETRTSLDDTVHTIKRASDEIEPEKAKKASKKTPAEDISCIKETTTTTSKIDTKETTEKKISNTEDGIEGLQNLLAGRTISREETSVNLESENTDGISKVEQLIEKVSFSGKLNIIVQQAKDLQKTDVIQKADPYAVVSFGPESYKSRKRKNTLNPVWNYEVSLDLKGTSPQEIEINLFDKDKFGKDDSLGRISLPVKEAVSKSSHDSFWLDLQDCKSGKILISTKFVGDELLTSTASVIKKESKSSVTYTHPSDQKVRKEIPSTEDTLWPEPEEASDVIHVTIHKGRNLENCDVIGKSDPFVIMKFGTDETKSKVIKNNLNPEWQLQTKYLMDKNSPKTLDIKVFDDDFGKTTPMGEVTLDIATIRNKVQQMNQWLPLNNCKSGEILVSTQYTPAGTTSYHIETSKEVSGATEETSPGVTVRTSVPDIEGAVGLEKNLMKEKITDGNKISTSTVSVTKKESKSDITYTHTSDHSVRKEISSTEDTFQPGIESVDDKESNIIYITVHKGRNLENCDVIGKSDPFVIMKFGTDETKSKVIKNNLNPEWQFQTKYLMDKNSPKTLDIKIFDDDFGKTTPMGEITLDIASIKNKGQQIYEWIPLNKCKSGEILVSTKYSPVGSTSYDIEGAKEDEDSSVNVFSKSVEETVSLPDKEKFTQSQKYYGSRLYGSDDVIGVEIGGALKNTIAIAAGVVEGLGLGQNALAGLITRGLAEVSRLAYALGARRETLSGLSGLGDLVLTCTGKLSRNRRVGFELGKGKSLDEIVSGMSMVAEGVRTTDAGLLLGACHGVELPITSQMSEVLAGRIEPRAAVEALMLRRQRIESEPD